MKETFIEDPIVRQVEKKLVELGGVGGVLWDLDGHFLDTTTFIHKHLTEFVVAIAGKVDREHLEIWAMMKRHSDEGFRYHHVSPSRWGYVTEMMAKDLDVAASRFRDEYEQLLKMYKKSPEMLPGARVTLELAKRLGLIVIWETNANVEWTMAKFDYCGLWQYTDNLIIIDEKRQKGVSDWWAGVALSKLPANRLIGGGDNVEADLIPLMQVGVRGVIGVPAQHAQAKGEIPEGVTMIRNIGEWAEGVLRLE